MKKIIKLGIPKGSLQNSTIELFKKAGFNIRINERSYKPTIDDTSIECLLIRAQEIPKYVEQGILDIGLSGEDWIQETDADVRQISELVYSKTGLGKVKLVIAVPENSDIKSVNDLQGKRIATELVNVTKTYLKKQKIKAEVEFSWGATEVKVPDLVDAISELTETGSSLRANNLRILDVILESSTKLIANKTSLKDSWKRQKIDDIALLLKAALLAGENVGLKMNVEKKNLKAVVALLPALKKPTVSNLYDSNSVAVEVIVEEKIVRDIIPKLRKVGAEGIVEYPLNKVIY
jgi:ATP phosphoribosyltransferase